MNKMKKMLCVLLAMVMVAGVCVMPTEAKSGSEQVKDIQNAIDNAVNGGTVLLTEDILWGTGEPIEIPEGKIVTLDLNGYDLVSLENFPVISVKSNAELTIVDYGDIPDSKIENAELEGWEDVYEEEWIGLLQVEENAKLNLRSGDYITGYNLFTSDSKGEVVLSHGVSLSHKPNISYKFAENNLYFAKGTVHGLEGKINWHVSPAYYTSTSKLEKNYASGQEIIISMNIENKADFALTDLYMEIGYTLNLDKWWMMEEGKEWLTFFVGPEPSDKYTCNGRKVYIDSIDAGETITVTYKGTVPEDLAGTEIVLVQVLGHLNTIENEVYERSTYLLDTRMSIYQVTADTQDPIVKEDVSKPVDNVTVVKNQETETTVKAETVKVVGDILSGIASEEAVSAETATKVAEAINNGKSVQAEIVVKEMKTEEVEQITATDKKAIEDKVATELGEDAKLQYLDLSIMLKADGENLGTLNKLEEEITITVAIPEELKAEGRIYKVIRNHNGEVTVLDTVVNADGTISFKTDRFSTYALAYADEEETNTNPNPGTPSTDNNKPSTDDNKDTNKNTNNNTNQGNKPATDKDAPKTGDNNSVMIYVAICLVALAAILVTKKRNIFAK